MAPAAAQAVPIEVAPASSGVSLGESLPVSLLISGLADPGSPSLGAFDLDLAFDSSILSLGTVTFGDPTLGDQLDLFGLGGATAVTPALGSVNLVELSFDSEQDLNTLQVGSFTLAIVEFQAIGIGISDLTLSINALGDAGAGGLPGEALNSSVTVVPEPSTAVLLGSALAALSWTRRGDPHAR